MNHWLEANKRAKTFLGIAERLATVTYPLAKEPRVLFSVVENLFISVISAMDSIIYFDIQLGHIKKFPKTFETILSIFTKICLKQHKFTRSHIEIICDLRDIVQAHKESPIEFTRKDRFVICSDSYAMKIIGIAEITDFLAKAKVFIEDNNRIIEDNERISHQRP